MPDRSLVSPDDQKVTFVELFFASSSFGVTQVVKLLHDGITIGHLAQAVLVFWLVWWRWTQFTSREWVTSPSETPGNLPQPSPSARDQAAEAGGG